MPPKKKKKRKSKKQIQAELERQQAEERKQEIADLKNKELAELKRREELKKQAELDRIARQQEAERLQKQREEDSIFNQQRDVRVQGLLDAQREKREWERYVACDPLPDASKEADLNAFLTLWDTDELCASPHFTNDPLVHDSAQQPVAMTIEVDPYPEDHDRAGNKDFLVPLLLDPNLVGLKLGVHQARQLIENSLAACATAERVIADLTTVLADAAQNTDRLKLLWGQYYVHRFRGIALSKLDALTLRLVQNMDMYTRTDDGSDHLSVDSESKDAPTHKLFCESYSTKQVPSLSGTVKSTVDPHDPEHVAFGLTTNPFTPQSKGNQSVLFEDIDVELSLPSFTYWSHTQWALRVIQTTYDHISIPASTRARLIEEVDLTTRADTDDNDNDSEPPSEQAAAPGSTSDAGDSKEKSEEKSDEKTADATPDSVGDVADSTAPAGDAEQAGSPDSDAKQTDDTSGPVDDNKVDEEKVASGDDSKQADTEDAQGVGGKDVDEVPQPVVEEEVYVTHTSLGGVISLSRYPLPALQNPVQTFKGVVVRDSSILTTELRPEEYGGSAPFLLKFKLPDYVFLGVPASHSLRMTAQGMKPFTSKQKPSPTPVSPPAPDLKVGWWNEKTEQWEEDGVSLFRYDDSTRRLEVECSVLAPVAVIQPRSLDFPFRSWRYELTGAQSAVFTVQGARFPVKIALEHALCRLVEPRHPALEHLVTRQYTPGRLLSQLARSGINLLPTDGDAKFCRKPCKDQELESSLHKNIAMLAGAFNLRGSVKNSAQSVNEAVMEIQPQDVQTLLNHQQRRDESLEAGKPLTELTSIPPKDAPNGNWQAVFAQHNKFKLVDAETLELLGDETSHCSLRRAVVAYYAKQQAHEEIEADLDGVPLSFQLATQQLFNLLRVFTFY